MSSLSTAQQQQVIQREDQERAYLAYRAWKIHKKLQRCPRRIILVRHGESQANVDSSMYSVVPDNLIPLSEKGIEQAITAGKRLRELVGSESVAFYVSPFLRSRMTLDGILKGSGIHCPIVREDPRLREQEWGNYQPSGATMEGYMKARKEVGSFYYRFPEGESGADVFDRVSSFLDSLMRHFKKRDIARNIVLVSHGITLRLFLMRYFRWTVEAFQDLLNPSNCDMVVMERPETSKIFCLMTELRSDRGLYKEMIPCFEALKKQGALPPPGGFPLPLSTPSPMPGFDFPPPEGSFGCQTPSPTTRRQKHSGNEVQCCMTPDSTFLWGPPEPALHPAIPRGRPQSAAPLEKK